MDVSENSGTYPLFASILIGFSTINHPFWGIPVFLFLKTPISAETQDTHSPFLSQATHRDAGSAAEIGRNFPGTIEGGSWIHLEVQKTTNINKTLRIQICPKGFPLFSHDLGFLDFSTINTINREGSGILGRVNQTLLPDSRAVLNQKNIDLTGPTAVYYISCKYQNTFELIWEVHVEFRNIKLLGSFCWENSLILCSAAMALQFHSQL